MTLYRIKSDLRKDAHVIILDYLVNEIAKISLTYYTFDSVQFPASHKDYKIQKIVVVADAPIWIREIHKFCKKRKM